MSGSTRECLSGIVSNHVRYVAKAQENLTREPRTARKNYRRNTEVSEFLEIGEPNEEQVEL